MISVYINSFGCRSSYWQTPSRREADAKKLVFGSFPRTASPCDYNSCLICRNWQKQHTKRLLNLCKATAGLWNSDCTQRGGSCGRRLQRFMDKCVREEHCRTFSINEQEAAGKSAQSTLSERAVSIVKSCLGLLRLHLSCSPNGLLQVNVCVCDWAPWTINRRVVWLFSFY